MRDYAVEVRGNNPYRERVHCYPQQLLLLREFEEDCKHVSNLLSGRQAFCELGSGSGGHLLNLATRHPNVMYFGFEIRYKRAVRTIEKAERLDCKNLIVVRENARQLTRVFPKHSLNGIYVNFPDPWEKKRCQKHRLLSKSLLLDCRQVIKAGGFLSIKTDHTEYFSSFRTLISSFPEFRIVEESRDLYSSPYLKENIQTEFERMFVLQGLKICYLRLVFQGMPFEGKRSRT